MIAPRRFFFYGTLLASMDNPVAKRAHRNLRDLDEAQVRGRLVAIPDPMGWYPALIEGDGWVTGRVYRALAGFGPGDLARLDRYEGYDPRQALRSEYRRACAMAVTQAGSRTSVQVYRYGRALPRGSRAVPGNDFAAWLAATRARPFAPRSA